MGRYFLWEDMQQTQEREIQSHFCKLLFSKFIISICKIQYLTLGIWVIFILIKYQMPTIILQIQKGSHILLIKQFENLKISKENIEEHVSNLTGLAYEQYDVYYIDAEDDSIMTVVEDDYAIAQMTLEADTITFHIEVKVEEEKIKFSQEIHQQEGNKQESQHSSHDAAEQEKVKQVQQSALSSQNLQQIQRDVGEQSMKLQNAEKPFMQKNPFQCPAPVQNQQLINKPPSAQECKSNQANCQSFSQCSVSDEIQSKKQVNQHNQCIISKNQSELRQISSLKCKEFQNLLEKPDLFELLFEKICQRLPKVLKPDCFIEKEQAKKGLFRLNSQLTCHICKRKICQIPYYINQRSEQICQDCERNYQENEILVKVRSQVSKAELLAVKFISISKKQVSSQDQHFFYNQTDSKLIQNRKRELILQKLSLQIKQKQK